MIDFRHLSKILKNPPHPSATKSSLAVLYMWVCALLHNLSFLSSEANHLVLVAWRVRIFITPAPTQAGKSRHHAKSVFLKHRRRRPILSRHISESRKHCSCGIPYVQRHHLSMDDVVVVVLVNFGDGWGEPD